MVQAKTSFEPGNAVLLHSCACGAVKNKIRLWCISCDRRSQEMHHKRILFHSEENYAF